MGPLLAALGCFGVCARPAPDAPDRGDGREAPPHPQPQAVLACKNEDWTATRTSAPPLPVEPHCSTPEQCTPTPEPPGLYTVTVDTASPSSTPAAHMPPPRISMCSMGGRDRPELGALAGSSFTKAQQSPMSTVDLSLSGTMSHSGLDLSRRATYNMTSTVSSQLSVTVKLVDLGHLLLAVTQPLWVGRGAGGAVVRAQWRAGATVAVKWLVTDAVDAPAAYMEALVSKMLAHPNVVQTFEYAVAAVDESFSQFMAPAWAVKGPEDTTLCSPSGLAGGAAAVSALDSAAPQTLSCLLQQTCKRSAVKTTASPPFAVEGPDASCVLADRARTMPEAPCTPASRDTPTDVLVAVGEDSFDGSTELLQPRAVDCVEVLRELGAAPGKYVVQIISEWCDEGTLHAAIRRGVFRAHGRRSHTWALRALLRTAREVALGMCHLHSLNIIHGDLKPGNVLLKSSRMDSRGFVAKVADFGLSRVCGKHDAFVPTAEWGTVPYMAGEYLDNKLCKSSDVYSFGVLLWQMYTGKAPFDGHHEAQIAAGVMFGNLQLEWPAGMPPPLARLGQACCRHEPEQRPSFREAVVALAGLETQVRDAHARAKLIRRCESNAAAAGAPQRTCTGPLSAARSLSQHALPYSAAPGPPPRMLPRGMQPATQRPAWPPAPSGVGPVPLVPGRTAYESAPAAPEPDGSSGGYASGRLLAMHPAAAAAAPAAAASTWGRAPAGLLGLGEARMASVDLELALTQDLLSPALGPMHSTNSSAAKRVSGALPPPGAVTSPYRGSRASSMLLEGPPPPPPALLRVPSGCGLAASACGPAAAGTAAPVPPLAAGLAARAAHGRAPSASRLHVRTSCDVTPSTLPSGGARPPVPNGTRSLGAMADAHEDGEGAAVRVRCLAHVLHATASAHCAAGGGAGVATFTGDSPFTTQDVALSASGPHMLASSAAPLLLPALQMCAPPMPQYGGGEGVPRALPPLDECRLSIDLTSPASGHSWDAGAAPPSGDGAAPPQQQLAGAFSSSGASPSRLRAVANSAGAGAAHPHAALVSQLQQLQQLQHHPTLNHPPHFHLSHHHHHHAGTAHGHRMAPLGGARAPRSSSARGGASASGLGGAFAVAGRRNGAGGGGSPYGGWGAGGGGLWEAPLGASSHSGLGPGGQLPLAPLHEALESPCAGGDAAEEKP